MMAAQNWKKERALRDHQRLIRETVKARCVVCSGKVDVSDRCQDGLYLHLDCARKTSTKPSFLRGGVDDAA
jgi:hypothetical protein